MQKEQELLEQKTKDEQLVNSIKTDYDKLKELLNQTSEQRVTTLITQLDEERANRNSINEQFLKTQAELKQAENRMQLALKELTEIKPLPDSNVAAYKPDGKIILIDNQTKIVRLNMGSDDKVYRGLTLSVYDKDTPIPADGKGKAEIEIFDVQKNISSARILRSEIKRPIIAGDIVANLIWDSNRSNVFVVAGIFNLGGKNIGNHGTEKIKELIQKWGGTVDDTVTVNADFVVLGEPPVVLQKPTLEELEVYPQAMEKYNNSIKENQHYNDVVSRAKSLWVPVLNFERFLYLIGYHSMSETPGAF